MTQITFEIIGQPVAQGRPRAGKSFSGKTVLYDPAKSRDFKRYVRLVAAQHKPQELITGPIALDLTFYKEIPKSWSNKKKLAAIRGEILPAVKSDIDNYAKSVMDGMSGIIYSDDKIVCDLKLSKRYGEVPRTIVKIKRCHL